MPTNSECHIDDISLRADKHQHTYTVRYKYRAIDHTPGPLKAMVSAQGNLPDDTLTGDTVAAKLDHYSLYGEIDNGAYAQGFDIQQRDSSRYHYTITVTYRPLDGNTAPGDGLADPVARPTKYSVEFWELSKVIAEARNVDPITTIAGGTRSALQLGPFQNAALHEYDEPVIEEDRYPVLIARKNFTSLADVLTVHRDFNRTVNNDTFYGYAAHCAMFAGIEVGELEYETNPVTGVNYTYVPATIRVALKDDKWYVPIVNRGQKWLTAGGDVEMERDSQGHPTGAIVLLTATGGKLPEGQIGTTINYLTRDAVAYTGQDGLGI